MPYAISPHYLDTNFPSAMSLDQKIDVFADRVNGWQLNIAQQCADNNQHSGFAVLSIVFSYFEMIAKYQDGYTKDNRPGEYFRKGIDNVFPDLSTPPPDIRKRIVDKLYKDIRCGLYHAGITGPNIELSGDFNFPIGFVSPPGKVQVNPHRLVPHVAQHFQSYVLQLRDPKNGDLRRKFEARFNR